MKRIGLLGGMSWESTAEYYRVVNQAVAERLGGLHSALLVMGSVDFAEVERMQVEGRWDDAGRLLAEEAARLQAAGADLLLICTNTMHLVADQVQAAIDIPLLNIIDVVAQALRSDGHTTVGLLGTAFTMEQRFYRDRLEANGLTVLVPEQADRDAVHRIIYDELCRGVVSDASRERYQEVVAHLAAAGAQAVVLGCTEIELLLDADQPSPVPLYPTTTLHARAAVDAALAD